jgi:hypothetical protein
VLKEQAKAQAQAQIEQMRIQAEGQAQMRDHQLKMAELQANLQLQQSNDMRDAEREQLRAQMQAQLDAQKIQLDRWKAELDAQMVQYKTDQDNATKLQIAGMNAEQARESETLRVGHEAAQKDADRKTSAELQKDAKKPDEKTGAQVGEIKSVLGEVSKLIKQLSEGQAALEKSVRAKRVLVRDEMGRPTHSEVQE